MRICIALICSFLTAGSSTAQWMDVSSSRNDISFDGAVGYMAADAGIILKTTDSGIHWVNVSNPFTVDLNPFQQDATDNVFFIKTFDGGQTVLVCSGVDGSQYKPIKFAYSSNGGETWTVTSPGRNRVAYGHASCFSGTNRMVGSLTPNFRMVEMQPFVLTMAVPHGLKFPTSHR